MTLTQVHTFDALSYILDVDRKPWPELLHPHHLAYGPLGAIIRSVAIIFGWQGSAAVLIQAANALAGAIGVTLFSLVVRRTTGRADLAATGALLLGSSYAFWYYAVEVEVYTIAALFLIIALSLIVDLLYRPSPAIAIALGCTQGLAVLFHQTNVLLSIPVAVALMLGGRRQEDKSRSIGRQLTTFVSYLLPLTLIVAGSYLWAGLGVSGFHSWDALIAWMQGYARTGWWGGAVDANKLAGLGIGLSQTLAQPGGALIGLGMLSILLASLRMRAFPQQQLVRVVLVWLLTYGVFFLWWEPDNIEFWIASLPPFYLLLLLGVSKRETGDRKQWVGVVLWMIGLAMLVINLGSIRQRGDMRTDLQRAISEVLEAKSTPGDLLVVPDGILELYLPYYAQRENIISLNEAMQASGSTWAAACTLLRNRVDQTLASGYAVLIANNALHPTTARPGEPLSMMERFGLTSDEVATCYTPLTPMMTALELGPNLPPYKRIAPAQELADGAGWDFRRGNWGWSIAHTNSTLISAAGWVIQPGVDSSLSSAPLQIDTSRYRMIELRLAASTVARDAQIFFLDSAGQAHEEQSLRWQLNPGPAMYSYRLNLRDAPGWQGIIGGLRLDPVGVGNGGEVTIESIRLLQ
ncbi:MAG: DUF2723 domain-containing protein [Oscillochloris sp.]|nr:DUF2723 domain-containing protein [Oscillochloris sp.]